MIQYQVWSNGIEACVVVQRRLGLRDDAPWAVSCLSWPDNEQDFGERLSPRLFIALQRYDFQWHVMSAAALRDYQQALEELMAQAQCKLIRTYVPISESLWQMLGRLVLLEVNWDSYGAQPISYRNVEVGLNVLMFSWHYQLPEPHVSPINDRGLEFCWDVHAENDLMITLQDQECTYLINVDGVEEEGVFHLSLLGDFAERLLKK